MANITTPHTMGGLIDAQKFDDNFEAIKTGLTDGTKDVNVQTTTISSDLNATSVSVAGNCTTEGEPNGDRVDLTMVRGWGFTRMVTTSAVNNFGGNTLFYGEDSVPLVEGSDTRGFVIPRSGLITGYSYKYEASAAATMSWTWKVSVYDADVSTTTSATDSLTTLGSFAINGATTFTTYNTFSFASGISFATGNILRMNRTSIVTSSSVGVPGNIAESLVLEIKYT